MAPSPFSSHFPSQARVLELLRAASPTELNYETILNHRVDYPAQAFLSDWSCLPHLGAAPDFLANAETDARASLSRRMVFDMATTLDSYEDILRFYAAVIAWGVGANGLNRRRVFKPLATPESTDNLVATIRAARDLDPLAAYRFFNNAESGKGRRVPYLGPAYFSKVMYFAAGPSEAGSELKPLILDYFVAKSLGWTITSGWRTTEYELYLLSVHAALTEWANATATTVTPDTVEFLLFKNRGSSTSR